MKFNNPRTMRVLLAFLLCFVRANASQFFDFREIVLNAMIEIVLWRWRWRRHRYSTEHYSETQTHWVWVRSLVYPKIRRTYRRTRPAYNGNDCDYFFYGIIFIGSDEVEERHSFSIWFSSFLNEKSTYKIIRTHAVPNTINIPE